MPKLAPPLRVGVLRGVLLVAIVFLANLGVAQQPAPSYEATFLDLHRTLGERYGAFAIKGIDWPAATADLMPRAATVADDREFGLLCLELVARLEDSHAALLPADRQVPDVPDQPQWDAGFVCLEDDRGLPVVYHVDANSPAAAAGVAPGMAIVSINDEPAAILIERTDAFLRKWIGYSSDRYRRYHAFRWFPRRLGKGEKIVVVAQGTDGLELGFQLTADLGFRYQPRLPVPVRGASDSADVSAARVADGVGYIHVRRIDDNLDAELDGAVRKLSGVRAMVVDVRGNSGGGFDASTAHANFDCAGDGTPGRPRFCGPVAVLVDPRCISAGEGWVSWFRATNRARFFGEATAGASARKETYRLINGHYEVRIPVKPYTGSLDRPIERLGIEPDVPLKQTAADLAAGRDTVLEAAVEWLENAAGAEPRP